MEVPATPIHLQEVVKIAFKSGDSAEGRKHCLVFSRVCAFSSIACIAKRSDSVGLFTPIHGIVELTDSEYNSAQLIGLPVVLVLTLVLPYFLSDNLPRLGRPQAIPSGIMPRRSRIGRSASIFPASRFTTLLF